MGDKRGLAVLACHELAQKGDRDVQHASTDITRSYKKRWNLPVHDSPLSVEVPLAIGVNRSPRIK